MVLPSEIFGISDNEPKSAIQHSGDKIEFFFEEQVIIEINKDGFFYKGEKVEDAHHVYERFNEWLKKAESHN